MTTTIADAEDSFLYADTVVKEWAEQFERQWYQPLQQRLMGALIASLPPEVAAQLRSMSPEAMAYIEGENKNAAEILRQNEAPY